jgi:hypothetical protein
MTVGMLAIAAASTLFLRSIGENIIDPRNLLGANLSDLGQHLLTLLGCYELSAAAIESAWGDKPIRYWRLAAVIFTAGMVITYRLGGAWSIPSDDFQLSDPMSLLNDWIVLTTILIAFAIVLLVSLDTMITGPLRLTMILMYALATIAIGCNAAVAILLIAEPTWVHARYHEWATKWTMAALWVLAIAGVPALRDMWPRRHDPHPH